MARAVTERRILQLLGLLSLYVCVALPANGQKTAFVSLKQLASEHRWLELRDEASHQKSTFYQAMAAAVFNEPDAERLFLEVIRQRPTSDEAYESFDWLSNIYLKSGRYRSLVDIMEARWAAFPDKKGVVSEKSELAPFRGLPNQENGPRRKSVLRHSADSLAVALSINNKPAKFFFDDGADVSSISEEEAKVLGMTINAAPGSMHTMTKDSGFRMAVAEEVVIGRMHFHNVSFAVFPDDQEPWSLVPRGERGIIGLPLMVAMGALDWRADGTLTVASKGEPFKPTKCNLFFDGGKRPVADVQFNGTDIWVALDTGAMTTDVYSPFAEHFAEYLKEHGSEGKNEIRGIGGADIFDAIKVPELAFTIDGQDVFLRPAAVMTKHSTWRKWIYANLGKDLLMQTGEFRIDFDAMALTLHRPTKEHSQ